MCEDLDDVRKVLRVNGVARSPLFQLLQRPSGVFEDLVIDEFELAARGQECDQAWNAVDDQARLALAFAQCFIGYGELARALRDAFLEFVGDAKQRVQRGADNPRRLAARPQGRQSHDAAQIVQSSHAAA